MYAKSVQNHAEMENDMNKENKSIQCTVDECKYHAVDNEYCTLDKILVSKHEDIATDVRCTDCESFEVSKDCYK